MTIGRGAGTGFGSGWISGVLAAVLGAMGLGGVLCLLFPEVLTSPQLRAIYPMGLVRGLIDATLLGGFTFGVLSVALRRNKTLGVCGLVCSMLGAGLGGSQIKVQGPVHSAAYLGLDWFLLDLLMMAVIFVPVERLFARLPGQAIFRSGWVTDLAYFGTSHLLMQALVLMTMIPAAVFFRWAIDSPFQHAVAAQPLLLQFVEVVVLADLATYAVHRLFHVVPWLWKFHAIHHSSQSMDWLAGSRLHLVDVIVTRAVAFVPLYAMGFSTTPVYAYLVFVSFHAVFLHANVRFRFGRWGRFIGTPQYHHWHHAVEAEAVDKNFAVVLPVIDRVFGTLYLPEDKWPKAYGIAGDPVPGRFAAQLVYPMRRG
jgi:sterol desaturase/sphingolipid hydroxylase (fatty acid hydroxylase superfamily)